MTRLSYLLGILAGLFFGDAVASKQFDPPRKNGKEKNKWVLIWEDNFDYKGLPSEKYWDYEEGYIRNHEAQYYTRGRLENARVENGHLIIEARKDD